ncbi:MAG: hypothetical protein M1825_005693 [Sarcosagium campestre]|nr:MAG: hypothetical protein M1825_005693 [Sarcosagium campestre]
MPFNPRKRDNPGDHGQGQNPNQNYRSTGLSSAEHFELIRSQDEFQNHLAYPASTFASNPLSSTQSMSGYSNQHMVPMQQTMQHSMLPDYSQPPMMHGIPAGGHQGHMQVLHPHYGHGLSLNTDQCQFNFLDEATLSAQQPISEGFPTPREFDSLLTDYIDSLSPKKQDKALIPRKRYENILLVLRDPKCTTIESAQFRFWAKKMFQLGTSHQVPPMDVVMHEGKPVAVREDLYRVLVEAHHICQHGGRDKTSAQVRKYYSWVPKELIARFVRNCPTCSVRRNPVPLELQPASQRNGQTTPPTSAHSNSPLNYSNQPTPAQPLSPVDSRRASIAAQSLSTALGPLGTTTTAMDPSMSTLMTPLSASESQVAFTYANQPGMMGTVNNCLPNNSLPGYPHHGYNYDMYPPGPGGQ